MHYSYGQQARLRAIPRSHESEEGRVDPMFSSSRLTHENQGLGAEIAVAVTKPWP